MLLRYIPLQAMRESFNSKRKASHTPAWLPYPGPHGPYWCFIPKSAPAGDTTEGRLEGTARVSRCFSQASQVVNCSFQTPRSPTQVHAREMAEAILSLRLCCKTLTSIQRALAAGHQPVPTTVQCHTHPFTSRWDPALLRGKAGGLRVSWKPQQELWSTFGKHQVTHRLQPSPRQPQKFSRAKTSWVPSSSCNQVYRKRTCSAPLAT